MSAGEGWHPEYNGYESGWGNMWMGGKVKQADVVLLAYPFGVPMDEATRRNDLVRYEAGEKGYPPSPPSPALQAGKASFQDDESHFSSSHAPPMLLPCSSLGLP